MARQSGPHPDRSCSNEGPPRARLRLLRDAAPTEKNLGTLDVSVVICAYTLDRWTDLQNAVSSVLAQVSPVHEIVVVIDHNLELLAEARGRWDVAGREVEGGRPVVRVVSSGGRPGLSGARNTGVEATSAPIVAFLDDDAEADGAWAQRLVEPYADARVMVCGGAAEPALATARPAWWPMEFDWVIGCSYRGLPVRRETVRNPIGANMSLRRSALEEVGGFQEGIGRVGKRPVGCEETDLCIRLVKVWPDALVVYEPRARVTHTVPPERLSWRYFGARCFAEGRSKALVAARVGRGAALASERAYVRSVLPSGIARGLSGAIRGDVGGAERALAIVAGLAVTTAGYLRGRLPATV